MNNTGRLDRLLRLFLGVASLEMAFFWLGGAWQMVAYAVGAVLVVTAGVGFCPLYTVLGIRTTPRDARARGATPVVIAGVVLVALAVGGGYASSFFTRKLFLEDFNAMNNDYKQALFQTGKNEREKAIAHYDRLLPAFRQFQEKYSAYRPYALKGDDKLAADFARVADMLSAAGPLVRSGDLHQAHLDLEKVRPVFQEVFKRNGFSMLSVALVDFHDAMELMLDAANARDDKKLVSLYPQVSDNLKVVEAEANDAEIQVIRKNLDDLFALAKEARRDQLPAKGEGLKSSFVKVYLKRG